jgi:hypothetical protein
LPYRGGLRSAAWTYKSLESTPLISTAICSDFSNGKGSTTYYHCFPSCAAPHDTLLLGSSLSVDKEQTDLLHSQNGTCIQSQTKNSSYDSEYRIIMQIIHRKLDTGHFTQNLGLCHLKSNGTYHASCQWNTSTKRLITEQHWE